MANISTNISPSSSSSRRKYSCSLFAQEITFTLDRALADCETTRFASEPFSTRRWWFYSTRTGENYEFILSGARHSDSPWASFNGINHARGIGNKPRSFRLFKVGYAFVDPPMEWFTASVTCRHALRLTAIARDSYADHGREKNFMSNEFVWRKQSLSIKRFIWLRISRFWRVFELPHEWLLGLIQSSGGCARARVARQLSLSLTTFASVNRTSRSIARGRLIAESDLSGGYQRVILMLKTSLLAFRASPTLTTLINIKYSISAQPFLALLRFVYTTNRPEHTRVHARQKLRDEAIAGLFSRTSPAGWNLPSIVYICNCSPHTCELRKSRW